MTIITLDVPSAKKEEYTKIFSKFVRNYSIKELEGIQNVEVDLSFHNINELSKKNQIAYDNSFNDNDLINI